MKTTNMFGGWMVLVGLGLVGSGLGCASESEVEEADSAFGTEEATPFDEQYFDFSLSWKSEALSEMVQGDPRKFEGYIDESQCTFKVSFRKNDKELLVVSGQPSMYAKTLAGSGMLTRSQLNSELSVNLGMVCDSREFQLRLGADLEFPSMTLGDKLNVEQKYPLVPKVQKVIRKEMAFMLTLKVKHSRATAGVLSNCSAFSNVPKEKVQRTFLSASSRYESTTKDSSFGGGKVTTSLDVAGGTLKKEFDLGLGKSAFVPIALCRNKAGFGSEGVAFSALGLFGSLTSNKPFANASGSPDVPLSSAPMKAGEERVLRHILPKGNAAFETVLKVY